MPNRPLNVLVADDAPEIRQLVAIALRRHGHRVVGCANGRDALALAYTEPFDVIVLDFHMPIMDGLSAARFLRAQPSTRHVPLISISAVDPESVPEGTSSVFDRFVPKPLSPRELVAVVQSLTRVAS